MTPQEAWSDKKIDINHLNIFEWKAYVHVFKKLRTKLDPKSKEHIMLGYCEDGTCYQLYDLETKKIIRARSVVFFEDIPETYKTTTIDDAADVEEEDVRVEEIFYSIRSARIC